METLDKLYLEYSQLTTARTARELKLEQANRRLSNALLGLVGAETIAELQAMEIVLANAPAPAADKAACMEAVKALLDCHT